MSGIAADASRSRSAPARRTGRLASVALGCDRTLQALYGVSQRRSQSRLECQCFKCLIEVLKKDGPVCCGDVEMPMCGAHVTPLVSPRTSQCGAKIRDEEVFFLTNAGCTSISPETADLWVGLHAPQEIAGHCRDARAPAKPDIKRAGGGSYDIKRFQPRRQCGRIHSEEIGSSAGARHPPACRFQRSNNVAAFKGLELRRGNESSVHQLS